MKCSIPGALVGACVLITSGCHGGALLPDPRDLPNEASARGDASHASDSETARDSGILADPRTTDSGAPDTRTADGSGGVVTDSAVRDAVGPRDAGVVDPCGAGGCTLPVGVPAFGGSSRGSGGMAGVEGAEVVLEGVRYRIIVPSSYRGTPIPLLVFITGAFGYDLMTETLINAGDLTGTGNMIRIVIEGIGSTGHMGELAMDDVRARYNVDNDRMYLISNSAGTGAGQELAFVLRPAWFAAYWCNDLTSVWYVPTRHATELGFAPWGQSGPGGNVGAATEVVNQMRMFGYRVPADAPYMGPGYDRHGSPQQGLTSLSWVVGKSRR